MAVQRHLPISLPPDMTRKRRRGTSPDSVHERRSARISAENFTAIELSVKSDTEPEIPNITSSIPPLIEPACETPCKDSDFCNKVDSPEEAGPMFNLIQRNIEAAHGRASSAEVSRIVASSTGLATPETETAREPSHDGTNISPYVANGLQYPAPIPSFQHFVPAETFPKFAGGNVFITSRIEGQFMEWQLHSGVLVRHSSWFARSMQSDYASEDSAQARFVYKLAKQDGKVVLVKEASAKILQSIEDSIGSVEDNVLIKEEEEGIITSTSTQPPSSTTLNGHILTPTDLYNQIFAAFYNIPLLLPTDSLPHAFAHTEHLLSIATTLSCPHLVRPHLNASLLQYSKGLYKSISLDPARWLLLSLSLQNTTIYTESLIHLIGSHPCWPNTWPTKRSALPKDMLHIIRTKATTLHHQRVELERDILLLTITTGAKQHCKPVQPHLPAQFDTWFVVSTFRHILSSHFAELDANPLGALQRGTLFRKLGKGGDAYMAYAEMRRLMGNVMPSVLEGLEEDLEILKESVREYVKGLARNECCLDVNEEGAGVGWLTCVKVGRGDVPWLAGVDAEQDGK